MWMISYDRVALLSIHIKTTAARTPSFERRPLWPINLDWNLRDRSISHPAAALFRLQGASWKQRAVAALWVWRSLGPADPEFIFSAVNGWTFLLWRQMLCVRNSSCPSMNHRPFFWDYLCVCVCDTLSQMWASTRGSDRILRAKYVFLLSLSWGWRNSAFCHHTWIGALAPSVLQIRSWQYTRRVFAAHVDVWKLFSVINCYLDISGEDAVHQGPYTSSSQPLWIWTALLLISQRLLCFLSRYVSTTLNHLKYSFAIMICHFCWKQVIAHRHLKAAHTGFYHYIIWNCIFFPDHFFFNLTVML